MLQKNDNFFYSIKMSEQTLKFGDIVVNKKEFCASKQTIAFKFSRHKQNSYF